MTQINADHIFVGSKCFPDSKCLRGQALNIDMGGCCADVANVWCRTNPAVADRPLQGKSCCAAVTGPSGISRPCGICLAFHGKKRVLRHFQWEERKNIG